MATSKITRNGQVTIPIPLRRKLGLREGTTVYFRAEGKALVMVPGIMVPQDQEWFWTPEWLKKEAEASEDLRRGRKRSFRTAKDATKWLNRKRR